MGVALDVSRILGWLEVACGRGGGGDDNVGVASVGAGCGCAAAEGAVEGGGLGWHDSRSGALVMVKEEGPRGPLTRGEGRSRCGEVGVE
jgi:hypothetical protein